MSARIFNREFVHPADGWYQIEVPGEHPNKPGGVVQIIDEIAVSSIVNRFNQEAADYARSHGVPFPGMLIDHEHFKHDADKETRAYGWLLKMENRNGVPFGEIRWTATGQQAVDGGEYRFFSSEYGAGDLVKLGGDKVRPIRLAGLTLTNRPNNLGGQPITNRDTSIMTDLPGLSGQRIPTAELEAWFSAVGALKKTCGKAAGGVQISFQHAWDLCKQQHPDLYAAAFGDDSATEDSTHNTKAAADDVVKVANRVGAASGKGFAYGWNFVNENLPRIFNRTFTKRQLLVNRTRESLDEGAVQAKAAKLFGRLANAEQLSTKLPFSQCWNRIAAREPVLHLLASGRSKPEEAFAKEPALQNRLQ
jgi:hypothetical protein